MPSPGITARWDFTGYLFDAYSVGDQIYLWLLDDDRRLLQVAETFFPVIYVCANPEIGQKVVARLAAIGALASPPRFEKKLLFYENRTVDALRIEIADPGMLMGLKRRLFTLYGRFDIYHSDLDPVSSYLSSRELYPLAPVKVRTQISGRSNRLVAIETSGSAYDFEYRLPTLRILKMALKYSHRLGVSAANPLILQIEDRQYTLAERRGEDYIHKLNAIIRAENPDCIISAYGDQIIFPFLYETAQKTGVRLELDRDVAAPISRSIRKKGSSFNTYGSWIYRSASYPLYGRWHIDQHNSFTFKHTDLAGTIELARISRMGVQRLARASTGNALTDMESDVAIRKNYLVPWQKSALENRKTWYELQLYDKGSLIYQPDISKGVVRHNVAQLDFSQMYPTIMHRHNISPETINCPCCKDDTAAPRVPETGYHICTKRRGVVSDALEHILSRRRYYKAKLQEPLDEKMRAIYEQRTDSLKWMNVVSFGYLGFRNAKFGKLESHESVTAFGRDKLLKAIELAERHGFELVHAITDCIFVAKHDESNFTADEISALCSEIYHETSVEMSTEGIYSWALFLPSRSDSRMPVANRYMGRFQTGKFKLRGIAVRRKDMPQYITDFQRELLLLMKDCLTAAEVAAVFPAAQNLYESRVTELRSLSVSWRQLLLRRTASHAIEDYQVMNGTSLTMRSLHDAGIEVAPGEKVRYLVVQQRHRDASRRYLAEEIAELRGSELLPYDAAYYIQMLFEAFSEIFAPFVKEKILAPADSLQPGIFGINPNS
jgi:DNA polymerase elongation subunit (family B)